MLVFSKIIDLYKKDLFSDSSSVVYYVNDIEAFIEFTGLVVSGLMYYNFFIIFFFGGLTLIPLGGLFQPPPLSFFRRASRPIGISRSNFMTFFSQVSRIF